MIKTTAIEIYFSAKSNKLNLNVLIIFCLIYNQLEFFLVTKGKWFSIDGFFGYVTREVPHNQNGKINEGEIMKKKNKGKMMEKYIHQNLFHVYIIKFIYFSILPSHVRPVFIQPVFVQLFSLNPFRPIL